MLQYWTQAVALAEIVNFFADHGFVPVGVDLSIGLLDIATAHHPAIRFVHADFKELPFDDQSFDGIWAHTSLIHLPDTQSIIKALQELYRVLKLNGVMHIAVKKKTGPDNITYSDGKISKLKRFMYMFDPQKLQKLLTDSGFKIEVLHDGHSDLGSSTLDQWIVVIVKNNYL